MTSGIELQNMTTNEQSLIANYDEENKGPIDQSNALVNEVNFFKDKARLMESSSIATGDEKAKNEIILSLGKKTIEY